MDAEREARLVEVMVGFFDQFRQHVLACIAELDLSLPHAATLLRLDTPLSQRQLADHLQCDASNVTAIVDRLEQRRLVERQIDPADRRIRRVVLTAEGARLVAALRDRLLDEAPLVGDLDDAERVELRDLLAKAGGGRTTGDLVEVLRGPTRAR